MRPHSFPIALACLALAAPLLVSTAAASTTGSPPGGPAGVWRTDGYGQYLRFDGARVRRFDTTAVSCLPAGTGTVVRSRPGTTRYAVPDDDAVTVRVVSRDTARLHVESATSSRVLHRVAALPPRCAHAAPADPVSSFDTFWATFAENYPFFRLHGVDWRAARDRFRPQVSADTTPDELFSIFSRMLIPLHDAHVALLGPDDRIATGARPGTVPPTPALDARVRRLVRTVDLPAAGATPAALTDFAMGRISFADLPGRVGYLRVSGFAGYTAADTESANRRALDRALDRILTTRRTASLRGLLVDLRVNGGGSDALALRLAGRLSARPHLAYAKQYLDGAHRWSRPQPRVVTPSAGYGGPLALLTSGSTVSAGETFVQAMLTRTPSPIRVGEATQGVFSDTLDRALPNGWRVLLPNERYLTATGAGFDARGVPPTELRSFVTNGPTDPLFCAALEAVSGHR